MSIISTYYYANKIIFFNKWKRINTGDITLFSSSGKIYSSAVTTYKLHSQSLAVELWDYNEKGETWLVKDLYIARDRVYFSWNNDPIFQYSLVLESVACKGQECLFQNQIIRKEPSLRTIKVTAPVKVYRFLARVAFEVKLRRTRFSK